MLVLNLPFKALMFLTLMRPSLVLFLVLWLKLVRSEERFSRNAETDLVCRLLLEKKTLNSILTPHHHPSLRRTLLHAPRRHVFCATHRSHGLSLPRLTERTFCV